MSQEHHNRALYLNTDVVGSWADEVGEYQWVRTQGCVFFFLAYKYIQYIHGTQPTSHYLATDSSYKNPADTSESLGLKLTVDSTSQWNSQFQRTELIPQTSQNLGTGNLFYHFSMMHTATNPPDVCFSHFDGMHLLTGLFFGKID